MTGGRAVEGESAAFSSDAYAAPEIHARPAPHGHLAASLTDAETAMMNRFRREYLELLDDRLAAIRTCVADDRLEDARVAVLSLESSSGMLGEQSMVHRLHDFRGTLETSTLARLEAMLAVIEAEAAQVRRRHEN